MSETLQHGGAPIEFWFDFASGYAYFAAHGLSIVLTPENVRMRLDAAAARQSIVLPAEDVRAG